MRRSVVAVVSAAVLALGACSSSGGSAKVAPPAASVTLTTAHARTIDVVLSDGGGRILYGTTEEAGDELQCTGDCLTTWPLLTVNKASGVHVASSSIRRDLVGTIAAPGGGRVVTYGGYPLHHYVGDAQNPGKGEGIAGYSAVGLDGSLVRIPTTVTSP